jgi:hypothetical protein
MAYFIVGSRGYLEVPGAWVDGDIKGNGEFVVKVPDMVRMQLGIGPDAQPRPGMPATAAASAVHQQRATLCLLRRCLPRSSAWPLRRDRSLVWQKLLWSQL